MLKKWILFMYLIFGFMLYSCEKQEYIFYDGIGKKPVYIDYAELDEIKNKPFMPVEKTGTIFLMHDTLFFMLEQKKGIHVYDISTEGFPLYLTFFNIPAITDFTISGDNLYADSWTDLLSIDISDIFDIQLVNRIEDMFKPVLFPPLYTGIFECVDLERGVIIDWVEAELDDAKCRVRN